MFVTHENKNTQKKKFQKPNILRKKQKGPAKPSVLETKESSSTISLVNATCINDASELQPGKLKCSMIGKPVQWLKPDNNLVFREEERESCVESTKISISNLVLNGNSLLINSNEENTSQSPVNIEFLLNDGDLTQNNTQFDIDGETDCHIKHDWCFDFSNGSEEIIIENFSRPDIGNEFLDEDPASCRVPVIPLNQESSSTEVVFNDTPVENLTVEYFASSTMNFKCDEPNCNKRFRSEQKLTKHKLIHNVDSSAKAAKLTTLECPVKKVNEGGTEERCGRTFLVRENLVKHLNEDHTPEDAAYVCGECGRRFFWASGVRAHARAHCGRPPALACAWPGCGRVFRQPCRLREHARAHTGDKPYPCRYPNCGWSFRTASKLLRHARRHTGERRHACALCGRAFLRREHLRDHCARHHAHKHACTHRGCQRTFSNVDALFTHMKKVHREEPAPETSNKQEVGADAGAEVKIGAGVGADVVAEAEWHAARTHCTWPLAPRAAVVCDEAVDDRCILEEDVQVELSEGSESNIYTIRSDLFLHGNVLTNEDSEHMPGVSAHVATEAGDAGEEGEVGEGAAPHAIDADLGLLDAHPNIDLMQEELMYTDAAVDESSFRVFLLSGEEIQIV